MSTTRSEFLAAFAASLAASRARVAPPGTETHDYVASAAKDAGAEPMWHGYPDECFSFTSFADSLVALAWGYGWYPQPPMVGLRNALVVDFCSQTEAEAEASIARWNGAWEFPMGTSTTVASEATVNAQNKRRERQLTIIGTAMLHDEFHSRVIEPLLDRHSCPDRNCPQCAVRPLHRLSDVFQTLAEGTDQAAVQLFSRWQPSRELREQLDARGVELRHHPLQEIPSDALAANRYYHIWSGTPLQAEEFRKTVWAPAWQRKTTLGSRA